MPSDLSPYGIGDATGLHNGTSKYRGPSVELSDRSPKLPEVTTEVHSDDNVDALQEVDSTTKSTMKDALDMRRMGKSQQLIRRFTGITIACFIATAACAWEYSLFLVTPGLTDGGIAGLLYNVIWSMFGYGAIYLSLAEMASIAPIAGSLYHWVSEFAPENIQGGLSYIAGWTSTIAYQAGNAQGSLLAGTQIQVMITIMDPTYTSPPWQGTLFSWAAILCSYVVNVYGIRALPYWQVPCAAIALMAYFAYIIPVWANGPTISSREVWTSFTDGGSWGNVGLAVLIGQLSGLSMQTGVDTAAHMSEEVKDASVAVPRAMAYIYAIDCAMILPLIITICYHLTNLQDALDDATTYPAIWVLRQCMSNVWILVIMVIVTALCQASNVTYLAAVSRDLFAFSRDNGVPLSSWLSKVDPKLTIPRNANIFSCVLSAILSLIYIGSPVAYYAITSLNSVAILQCYALAIGCILWRRLKYPESLPHARWSLGRLGVPINIVAVCYASWGFFWCFWPQAQPVTAGTMNWAGPIYVLSVIVGAVYYLVRARHKYVGPVLSVEGRHVGSN